jgi:predicted acylesterase/phospholipase RssA
MKASLPKIPFQNLALSLSGGGYKAASFHLGLLSYLSALEWQGSTLLERVRILSTVSGGTFTGLSYAAAAAKKEPFKAFFLGLYRFLNDIDVIKEGLQKLENYKDWNCNKSRSLINAFSLVYFDKLEKNNFSLLFDKPSHLKEIIFNTTEFNYGLPFRFQKCEFNSGDGYDAFFGNHQVNIPPEFLREVQLSDVIAASSCFPMGFEPINFPADFINKDTPLLKSLKESWRSDCWGQKCRFPIGLMDGGIVDNQGIDSVIWAEQRMRNYKGALQKFTSTDERAIDLYIISDVSTPFMDSYVKTEQKPLKSWRNFNFKSFHRLGYLLLVSAVMLSLLVLNIKNHIWIYVIGILTMLLVILGATSLVVSKLFRKIIRLFKVPKFFTERLGLFSRMKFGIYETFIKNRISSVISMVSEVFMKQIRRQEYDRVYDQDNWKTRLVMNAVYELTEEQSLFRKKEKQENSDLTIEISPKIKQRQRKPGRWVPPYGLLRRT